MIPWKGNSEQAVVDVFVTTYNHALYCVQAVESVALQRFRHPFNIWVYDDHSNRATRMSSGGKSDNPRKALWALKDAGYDVEIGHENIGVCRARNHCLTKGQAEYVLFLDGDDHLDPLFLEKAWRRARIAQADVVYPKMAIFSEFGSVAHGSVQQGDFSASRLFRDNYIPVTSLMKRDCVSEAGGFDDNLRSGFADWELWIRLALLGKVFIFESEAVLYYRHHPDAMSHSSNARQEELISYIHSKHNQLYNVVLKPREYQLNEEDELVEDAVVMNPA